MKESKCTMPSEIKQCERLEQFKMLKEYISINVNQICI